MTDFEGPFLHAQSPLEQQAKNSQFERTSETEKQYRKNSAEKIEDLERALNLAQRALSIQHAPGFEQFIKEIEKLRTHAQNEMMVSIASNEYMRVLQGRCQAHSSILAIMRNTEQNIESLAQQLNTAKQKAESTIRPDGKVVPESILGGF